ncbi:ribosomal protection tetracycline resistance protein [Streptosporangium album]|uniref:Ribosomal protection tetracycline resistance protein n=1 Tax=Streptosporangium album TaxID=47479 RepID=A0A7W7W6X2_9ACTN|nr:TetM/TetW/TetO/TetS family tetracycline resistance ribosomal protection protein [Streptosporangium album]MBB4936268.1 ribosomal protection tetracycline resistance protein [Streptosporangium album]
MHILNIGILAHVDAGKTSLTERLLFDTGTIDLLGSVDTGSTQTDTDDIERRRGITIRSAVASFAVGALQVNLIDTPGHSDFIAEVERALGVLDGAILVLSAVEGVQAQTRVLMKTLRAMRLPTLIFVNKIDRAGARHDGLVADIRRKLAQQIIPMNTVRQAGSPDARAVANSLDDPDFHSRVAETLGENDDTLLAGLVAGAIPSGDRLLAGIRTQTAAGLLHPVFFGSAMTGQGVEALIGGISRLLPPVPGTEESRLPSPAPGTEKDGPRGTVFAIERGGTGEKIAYLRMHAGEVRARQRITSYRREADGGVSEENGQITALQVVGPARRDTRHLTAGNIAKVWGLPHIRVGDQIGSAYGLTGQPHFAPPTLETLARPKRAEQAALLHAALVNLADRDPLIHTRAVPGEGTSVVLYGEVQKEVIAETLFHDFGVEAVFEPSRTIYIERPVGAGEAYEEISRHGHNEFFATVGLRIEPAAGPGITFRREVERGSLPRPFHRAIEDAVRQTLGQGIYGWAVTDCAVTLTRTGYAPPISTAGDFRNLTPLVLMRALDTAGTRVYEPCHAFEVEVPSDGLSAVTAQLAALGADIRESYGDTETWSLRGDIPARQVPEFERHLPGLSHGEGVWWSRPYGDRRVSGPVPVRERSDGNPLNRKEYLRYLARRGTAR